MFQPTTSDDRSLLSSLAAALALMVGLGASGGPAPAAAQELVSTSPAPPGAPERPTAGPSVGAAAGGDGELADPGGDLAAEIEAYVADAWPADGPGAAVIVAREGEPVVATARGRADLSAGTPLRPGTVFMLGSTTKQFTAAVVMQLAEEGAVALDDPLAEHLPRYEGPNPDATVRQLLAHTAGVPDIVELPGWDQEKSHTRPRTTAGLIDVFEEETPAFEPGADWDYSSSNYVLLGALVEAVTGKAWHEAVRERIAEPLGLETLRYGADPAVREALAEGYTSSDGGPVPADDVHASNGHAAGGLAASARDLAAWMHALHTGEVVSRESFEAMTTPGEPNDPATPYGFGLRIEEIRGHRTVTHGGYIDGFTSQTVWAPEEDLYVAVLANSDDPAVSVETASRRIAARALGDPYPTFEVVDPDMGRIEPLLGRYEIRGEGDTRDFYARNGKLYTLRSGSSESRVHWAGDDRFFYGPGSLTWFRVVRSGDGAHRMEMHQQGAAEAEIAVRTGPVDRPEFVDLSAETLDAYVGRYRLEPGVFVHVTRAGDGLKVRLTGQSAVPIRPVSETGFRLEGIDAKVVFRLENGEVVGLVIHQGGQEIPAERVTSSGPGSTRQETPAADTLTLEELEGRWMGTLMMGDREGPRLGLRILRKADGTMGASAASPDQGADFMPASARVDGTTLTVRLDDPEATIVGQARPDSGRIEAELRQGSAALSVTLERVDELPAAGPIRPQTPRPPYPYEAEDVRFQNPEDGVWLAGTLTRPGEPGPHPAAIVLPCSGPQDRGVPGTGGHKPQAVIADRLTKAGFAVLRYDKRGVYESSGSYGDATDGDLARDAVAAYRYLTGRDDVDPGRTGFVGHSQGSLLAARAAASMDGEVGFIVSMAGTGLPLFDLLVLQDGTQAAAEGATGREVELIRDFSRRYYRTAMETEGEAAREEALEALYDSLEGAQERAMEAYFPERPGTLDPGHAARDAFVEDLEADPPAGWWKQVRAPVLVLNGGRDSQVPAEENVGAIVDALEKGPAERFESEVFPDKNHMFQTAETGAVDEYRKIEQTVAPEVIDRIVSWVTEAVDTGGG